MIETLIITMDSDEAEEIVTTNVIVALSNQCLRVPESKIVGYLKG